MGAAMQLSYFSLSWSLYSSHHLFIHSLTQSPIYSFIRRFLSRALTESGQGVGDKVTLKTLRRLILRDESQSGHFSAMTF